MTSTHSLAAAAAADVTWERVRGLVDLAQPESLTLEYKSDYASGLVKTVAAMANSYGGIILVGVTDSRQVARNPTADRIVGVPGETTTKISEGCRNTLEPPWQPEIIEVAVPDQQDTFVMVVRVDPARAPRPILVDGKAPIRLHGSNHTADRTRLWQLFAEASAPAGRTMPSLPRPQLPGNYNGSPAADYILRSGMQVPVDYNASWRPLSERGVSALADALNTSPLQQTLLKWCGDLHIYNLSTFRRQGFNRARYARLVWHAIADDDHRPIEIIAEAVLPTSPGVPNSHLRFTIDVVPSIQAYIVSRIAQALPSGHETPQALLNLGGLHRLVGAVLATLTDQAVVDALADLVGIDPIAVPQPSSLDLHGGPAVSEFLDLRSLVPIDDAGASHGANLLAQPALDLRDPIDRHQQVDDWLVELALDAGFTGMEDLLDQYHSLEQTPTPPARSAPMS